MGSALRVKHVAQERVLLDALVRAAQPLQSATAHVQRVATVLVVRRRVIVMVFALPGATVHAVAPQNIVMDHVGLVTFRTVLRHNVHDARRAVLQSIMRSMHAMTARLASSNRRLVRPCVFRATVKRSHSPYFASMFSLVTAMALAVA